MSQLNFTTGNPNNLTGNANASMNDIQGSFVDVRSFLNGGNLAEDNVPNLTAAFTTYKVLAPSMSAHLGSGASPGDYGLGTTPLTNTGLLGGMLAVNSVALDPAAFSANARTTKYRLRAAIITNGTAPTGTFTPSLRTIATVSGGAGVSPQIATAPLVTGSNGGVVTTPGANSISVADSGDFTAPALGLFAFAVTTSAAIATNASVSIVASLLMRQV